MPKVLTNNIDKDFQIGAYMFPDRKKPCLCVQHGSSIRVVGTFQNLEAASIFMHELAQMIGAVEEEGE